MSDLDEVKRTVAEIEARFDANMTRMVDILAKAQTTTAGQATITVNAGGIGVWIATTACCVMVAVGLMLGVIVVDQGRQIDRLNEYLSAIYMQAPHLKPERDQ